MTTKRAVSSLDIRSGPDWLSALDAVGATLVPASAGMGGPRVLVRYPFEKEAQHVLVPVPCPERSPSEPPATAILVGTPFSGPYVGLFAGGLSQKNIFSWSPNLDAFGSDTFPLSDRARANLGLPGVVLGGTFGYDHYFDKTIWGAPCPWFAGLAFDVYGNTGRKTRSVDFSSFGARIDQNFSSNVGGDVLGRFGVPLTFSNGVSVMPYVTGGLALKEVQMRDSIDFLTSFNSGSRALVRPGWTGGAGLAFSLPFEGRGAGGRAVGIPFFTPGVPFRIELQWLHRDFGKISYLAPNNLFQNSFIRTTHRFTEEQGTIGVSVPLDSVLQRVPVF